MSASPFDIKLAFAYIALCYTPALLLTQLVVTLLLPKLQSFPKPRKLVFYLLYLIPEIVSFVLLWLYYIVPVCQSVTQNSKFVEFSNQDINYKCIIGVLYYYVMAYTAELLHNHKDMHFMLKLHHLSAITITLIASFLCLSSQDLLTGQFIIISGTSAVLHASIDFIPHIYMILRQMKARPSTIKIFGFLSTWPLTIFRLMTNVFFVVIVKYYLETVLQNNVTPLAMGWTVISGAGTISLAVTQIWAHNVYVAIQSKDARPATETMSGKSIATEHSDHLAVGPPRPTSAETVVTIVMDDKRASFEPDTTMVDETLSFNLI